MRRHGPGFAVLYSVELHPGSEASLVEDMVRSYPSTCPSTAVRLVRGCDRGPEGFGTAELSGQAPRREQMRSAPLPAIQLLAIGRCALPSPRVFRNLCWNLSLTLWFFHMNPAPNSSVKRTRLRRAAHLGRWLCRSSMRLAAVSDVLLQPCFRYQPKAAGSQPPPRPSFRHRLRHTTRMT